MSTVPSALDGERVDRVVALLVGCTRTEASTLVVRGAVTVDGVRVAKGSVRVAEGSEIEIAADVTRAAPVLVADARVSVEAVYEDRDLVVVDKPAGLVVHPGNGHADGTLVHGLLARYPEIASVGDPARPGIVHRIDKDTSGLLVVARSTGGYAGLVPQIAAHDVVRRYLALVWGAFDAPRGLVDAPIGRSARTPTRMAVSATGRDARTAYEVVDSFTEPAAVTLVRCTLDTGRTHQIRVHLQTIGHPVVGDRRYGGHREPFNALARFFLHAEHLELRHPVTGSPLVFDSPLPPDLDALVSQLTATASRPATSPPRPRA
ncbi:MAG TPA: RluA family pseudouridine synthase [Acidimicrobiales bacterium]|jgi:23S rRNA pseudouridine1911/1915/1917 synthase|nr:RluA family pseudouridine synthase [Acidimicrobiales bacterium]